MEIRIWKLKCNLCFFNISAQRASLFPNCNAQMGFGYADNIYGGALGTVFGAVICYAQVRCMSNDFFIVLSI